MGTGATAYALVLFVEANSLWYSQCWAEWLAALSGGVYVPFELFELNEPIDWLNVSALRLSLAVVAFMLYRVLDDMRACRAGCQESD